LTKNIRDVYLREAMKRWVWGVGVPSPLAVGLRGAVFPPQRKIFEFSSKKMYGRELTRPLGC